MNTEVTPLVPSAAASSAQSQLEDDAALLATFANSAASTTGFVTAPWQQSSASTSHHLASLEAQSPSSETSTFATVTESAETSTSLPSTHETQSSSPVKRRNLTKEERLLREFNKNPIPDLDLLEQKLGIGRKAIRDFFSKRRRKLGIEGRVPRWGPGGAPMSATGAVRSVPSSPLVPPPAPTEPSFTPSAGIMKRGMKRALANLDAGIETSGSRPKRASASTSKYTLEDSEEEEDMAGKQVGDEDVDYDDEEGGGSATQVHTLPANTSYEIQTASLSGGGPPLQQDSVSETLISPSPPIPASLTIKIVQPVLSLPLEAQIAIPRIQAPLVSTNLPATDPHHSATPLEQPSLLSSEAAESKPAVPLATAQATPSEDPAHIAAVPLETEQEAEVPVGITSRFRYATSAFLPNELLIAQFEKNPFPTKEEVEAIRAGKDLSFRQIADWFTRHRRTNNVSVKRGRRRGRPPGSGRGTARGKARNSTKRGSSREDSAESEGGYEPTPPPIPVSVEAQSEASGSGEAKRKRGRPKGSGSTRGRKKPGHGWGQIQDDDENDYGSTTTEDELEEPYTAEMQGDTGLAYPGQTYVELGGGDTDPEEDDNAGMTFQSSKGKSRSGSPLTPMSWLLAAAEDAASMENTEKAQCKPLTTYSTLVAPGLRPLTYFNKPPPPQIAATWREIRNERSVL